MAHQRVEQDPAEDLHTRLRPVAALTDERVEFGNRRTAVFVDRTLIERLTAIQGMHQHQP